MHYNGFSVEQIMIAIQQLLEEHKREAAQEASVCGGKEEHTEINVRLMNSDEQFVEIGEGSQFEDKMAEEVDPANICLFVSCSTCSFLDFTTIN